MNYFSSWREISNLTKIYWNNYKRHPKITKAKTQRLDGEMEEFSILALDGDDAICDLKILLANIAKGKQETTEREER